MSEFDRMLRGGRRGSTWGALAIYLGVSWAALQVVRVIVETAGLPDWLPGMALVLLVIGFPIVLVTALLQGAPGGQGGEAAAGRSVEVGDDANQLPDGEAPAISTGSGRLESGTAAVGGIDRLFTWKNALVGGVAAFALWGVVATGLLLRPRTVGPSTPGRVAIAILPFASPGTAEEDLSLALGIHEDLLTQLHKVGSMQVISRTSVMEYKDTQKKIPEIGQELGVDWIMEGSVQRSGDRIHMNAQLIDARSEGHVWAETFDRDLSVEGIFDLQRRLAERIAAELNTVLQPEEAEAIGTPSTDNLEALGLYHQANQYFHGGPRSADFELAFDLYEKAITLDPTFADAYARLALAHGSQFEVGGRDPADLEATRTNAERALALDPESSEAQLALGQYYYSGFRDHERALEHLEAARRAGDRSPEFYHNLGAVQRRMGDLRGAIESFRAAIEKDPRSAHLYDDLGSTYMYAEELAEAVAAYEQAVALAAPEDGPRLFRSLVNVIIDLTGDLDRARARIEEMGPEVELTIEDFSGRLSWLSGEWEALYRDVEDPEARPWVTGELLMHLGRQSEAGRFFEADLERFLPHYLDVMNETRPQHPIAVADAHLHLAELFSFLERHDEAVAQADSAEAILPISKDYLDGSDVARRSAWIFARAGQLDRAVPILRQSLTAPDGYTLAYFLIDDWMDFIRDVPEVRSLVEELEAGTR